MRTFINITRGFVAVLTGIVGIDFGMRINYYEHLPRAATGLIEGIQMLNTLQDARYHMAVCFVTLVVFVVVLAALELTAYLYNRAEAV